MILSSEAENTPASPDQVNACGGSVSSSRSRGRALCFLLVATLTQNAVAWDETCSTFGEIYADGKELCEILWDDAFEYTTDEDKAYTMWWFSADNPNFATAANLNLTVPDTCEIQWSHKENPSPETDDFTECHPWKDLACCHDETVASAEALRTLYGPGYEWDRCGKLSPECERFFVQEACLYECDVTAGLYRLCSDEQVQAAADNKEDECHQNTWQLYKMPIKASYCDAWYTACRHDRFCGGGDGKFSSCENLYQTNLEKQEAAAKVKALADAKDLEDTKKKKKAVQTNLSIIIVCVVLVLGSIVAFIIFREKKGKPVFEPLVAIQEPENGQLVRVNSR